MSTLKIDEDNLTAGLLTLVVTLVEIIQEALETQAVRRIEGGTLTAEEQERLGNALLQLDEAMAQLKLDHGIADSVAELRRGLDDIVADLVEKVTNP
ncbi:gas vesicle protein K [Sinomonas gamaensis]|uniref:gas vesicle protein K n=1 Tax=Sinomonas gamaensis TaxID=2565624 RepID=UPI0011091B1A|nr:gas vesicle protein K [Sinomonas gamaensis]